MTLKCFLPLPRCPSARFQSPLDKSPPAECQQTARPWTEYSNFECRDGSRDVYVCIHVYGSLRVSVRWVLIKFEVCHWLRGGTSTPWQWSAQSRRKERVSLCLQLFEESWNWSEPNSYTKESCFSKAGGDDNWREHAKVSNKKGDFVLNLALFFNCQCEKKTKKTAANYDNRSVVLLRLKKRMHRQIQFSCQLDCVCPC